MTVRPPAVAGRFYPGDAGALADLVDRLLDSAAASAATASTAPAPEVAFVVPHAGYRYSGPTAAHAYARLRGAAAGVAGVAATRFVIAGPAHRAPVRGCVVPAASAWATPLGEVPVDVAGAAAFADAGLATVDDGPFADEHSLEVQLPFLQRIAAGPFSVLPVAVGLSTVDDSAAMLAAAAGPGTVLLCSTDLSHYQDEATATRQDAGTVRAVLELAPARIAAADACGAFALRGLLGYARATGLNPALLDRSTSARASGDTGRVVGYASFAFTAHPADAGAT